jgi:hypothetical protein
MRTSRSRNSGRLQLTPCAALLPMCVLASAGVAASERPEQAKAASSVASGYVDQLIDPSLLAEPVPEASQDAAPRGQRFFSVEYQHYQERQDPYELTENGVLLDWRRETLNYGEIQVEALGRAADSDEPLVDTSGNGYFILNQYGFAIDEDRVMDNTLGLLRSVSDPLISRSFRLNLSSTLMAGAQSRITHDGVSSLYLSAGRIGRLGSGQIQSFDVEGGEQFGLGYSRQINNRIRAGTHLVHVQGADEIPDHQSLASALQVLSADGAGLYSLHTLVDSEEQYGLWVDGDSRTNRWRHRYGLFRLEPDLLWSDNEPNNDQQGAYLRSDLTTLRNVVSVGLDVTQTDISDREDRAGANLYNGFVNTSWRMDRATTVGGTAALRSNEPRDDFGGDRSRLFQLSGFVAHGFSIGGSRLQLLTSRIEQGGDSGGGYGLIWDQDWNTTDNLSFSSTLSYETETGLDDSESRSGAAVLVRHALTSRVNWNADLSYFHVDRTQGSSLNTTNGSVSVVWRFLPGWDASLRATYNKVADGLETDGIVSSDDARTLLFSLRYSEGSGQPYAPVGTQTGAAGYGSITGLVFYDENGDGQRQAGERAASGVVVYLDRRYQSITDGDGRYVFEPVSAGRHQLTLAQEDLPLPWGLIDEAPRALEVAVRSRISQDFALQQLNQ